MKRPTRFLIVAALAVVLGGLAAFLTTRRMSPLPSQSSSKAVYYCPMHPSYTSDRPGDCPICNMRLARKDETSAAPPSDQAAPGHREEKSPKDICYLHQCPMGHDGKPCPMLVVAKEGERVTCPVCGAHVVEVATVSSSPKILYWTDPMIPGYKADGPGKSPMGMDLVPVYEETAGAPAAAASASVGYAPILVSPKKQQLIGVKTAPVERRSLTKTIRTVGTIAYDPELYQAQAEFLQALQALERAKQGSLDGVLEQAESVVESSRLRLRQMGFSEELIQELSLRQTPDRSLLLSQPGEPVWVYAQIYEYELPLVRTGQALTAERAAMPGDLFQGTIRAIDPVVDPMTRTARVRAQLPNPQGDLKPQMYVNVAIAVDLGELLTIPSEAVFDTGARQVVFVDKGEGLFEPRDVVVGARGDGFVGVKAGLAEGERVVTSGNFLIDSESRLKAALEGMTPSTGSEPSGTGHPHGQ